LCWSPRTEAAALRRARDWPAAYEAFRDLEDRDATVVESQAEAAWWLGRMDESIALYQDAYRAYLDAGDPQDAARTAVHLSIHTRLIGEAAQSAGWTGTAHRLLKDLPEGPCHGYAMYLDTAGLTGTDLEAASASALRMQEIGRTHGDPTLVALGVYFEGRIRIKQARVAEGLALLDEAMVAALTDGPGPLWTGAIYCGLMDACNELRDLRRASEWTEATRRWSHPLPLASVYPGICRVHRAQVLQSAATGPRPRKRRSVRASTWSASTSSPWPTPTTRSARYVACAVTTPAPSRPTTRPTTTAATLSPAWRCSVSPRGVSRMP
jgi:hypothetical protein